MKNFLLLLLFLTGLVQMGFAQNERYIDEVFDSVMDPQPFIYGYNATIAPFLFDTTVNEAIQRPLNGNIYMPEGDTETDRPLIMLLHTGNFLPVQLNGGCGGTIMDNDMVNFATKLAKRGYVVAVIDYRIGWVPTIEPELVRRFLLINAAYRGVQDSRTAVRYFKKTVDTDGNPFGIDPSKIGMWGFGTGAYITYASATLDNVEETEIPKFFNPLTNSFMVSEFINGDVNATEVGYIPPGVNYLNLPEGDTLCYPNHVGYSSDFQFAVHAGGAMGDTSWVDANSVPSISYHVPTDPFAPCATDILVVPGPNYNVVEVSGPCTSQAEFNADGANAVFDVDYIDDVSAVAAARTGESINTFLPFPSNDPLEAGQWSFHQSSNPYNVTNPFTGMPADCDTDEASAQMYVDSMLTYFAPRACLAMGLGCNLDGFITNLKEISDVEVGLSIAPNPAVVDLTFTAEKNIEHVYLYDMTGRLVKARTDINNTQYTLDRNNLPNGLYIAQVRFAEGFVSKKIVFN